MKRRIERPVDIVAIDDEPLALARLAMLVRDIPGTRLIGSSCDPDVALAFIAERQPDIVLLDIQMPGTNGIELASRLGHVDGYRPFVIFVTAFEQHAIRAFQAQAIDYVLKPVTQARLEQAIARVRFLVHHQRMSAAARDHERRLMELSESAGPNNDPRDSEEIWAMRGSEFVRLRTGEIERAESDGTYASVSRLPAGYE